MKYKLTSLAICSMIAGTGAHAGTISFNDLTFKTDVPQSAWGTGQALEIADTIPFVAEWDENLSFGDIADLGSVPNPLYVTADGVYTAANATYNTANSAYKLARDAYNGCLGTLLGNAVTCSPLAGARNVAKATRDGAKTTRDNALAARNALSAQIDLGQLGTKVAVASTGTVGVELDYKISAGSVDPVMTFAVGADVPDTVDAGQAFSIAGTQTLLSGEVASTAPGFEFAASTIVDVDLSASAIACATGCISGGGTLIDIDQKTEVISVDNTETRFLDGLFDQLNSPVPLSLTIPTGELEAQVFVGVPTPVTPPAGVEVNGIGIGPQPAPPSIEVAAAKLSLPQIETDTELKNGKLVAEGSDQVLQLSIDVDGVTPGIPPGGLNFSFGPAGLNAGASFDAFDIKAGPTMDLTQRFEIDGDVIVDLQFSQAVSVKTQLGFITGLGKTCLFAEVGTAGCGPLDFISPFYDFVDKTSFTGIWGDLPEMKLYGDTTFTPEFSAAADMLSVLGLQFGVSLDILFGQGDVNVGPLKFEVGPIYSRSFPFQPDFAAFDVYNELFSLGGWNSISGQAFTVRVNSAIAAVPLPAPFLMMLGALIGLVGLRRRV